MIKIINKGLNKKGVKEINKFIEHLREKHNNKKWLSEMRFLGYKYNIEDLKSVKVGDKIGYSYKILKQKSISDVKTIGSYVDIGVLLEYIDYEVKNI
jgi:hypothetical protein